MSAASFRANHQKVYETIHKEITNYNLMVALKERSRDHKFSGLHLLGTMNVCAKSSGPMWGTN